MFLSKEFRYWLEESPYREKYINESMRSRIKVLIGDVEGDIPIHAQNLHEVVLRNVSQLNEQITRLEYRAATVFMQITCSSTSFIFLCRLFKYKVGDQNF